MSLFAAMLAEESIADSWSMPSVSKYHSVNREYFAKVTPGRKNQPPTVSVYKASGANEEEPLWTASLSNRVSPVTALLANDGKHVVTFDNWHRVGYGDDVIAFYTSAGQRKRYTLEQALDLDVDSQRRLYSQFSHTVSSRWWRTGSLVFLDEETTALGIWVDWLDKWFVWNLSDGGPVELTEGVRKRWNKKGRSWARNELETKSKSDGDKIRACRFLASLKLADDRGLLQETLKIARLDVNSVPSLRQAADRALAIFDSKSNRMPLSAIGRTDGKDPYLLGSAEIEISLPFALNRHQGHYVKVWVFPESVEPQDWNSARPDRYRSRALRRILSDRKKQNESVEMNTIQFKVDSILPGKYWAKVVLDRPGFLPYNLFGRTRRAKEEEYENGRLPMAYVEGDYQSHASMMFEVRSRETTRIKLDCNQAITAGDPKFNLKETH